MSPWNRQEAQLEPFLQAELARRRFELMARQVVGVRWSYLAIVAVIAAVLVQASPAQVVAAWIACAVALFELRARWLLAQIRQPHADSEKQVRHAVIWNAAFGAAFGCTALFMVWLDTAQAAVLSLIVVSSAAGAVAISGPLVPVYLGYTVSIMTPFALAWALTGGWIGIALAVLMGSFVKLQYDFALRLSRTFTESFLIRRENEELVQELIAARDQADAANRAKTRFLAAASHDLRQPLHALSMQSSALLLDPRAEDSPEIAGAISRSIENLSALLDSLLDISKLDAGTLVAHMRPIHLSRLLDALGRSVAPLAQAKGLEFRLSNVPGQVVMTDPVLLERVLRNLVDNAIKFTEQGSIQVQLEPQDDHLRLTVRDTGIGIDPEQQPRVWEEFFQVDESARGGAKGLGLGLSIVARLVRLLGIAIQLDSQPGQGTAVVLKLPRLNAEAEPVAAAPELPRPSYAGLEVLVLDDDEAIRLGVSTLLRRMGCSVQTADTVDHARLAAGRTPPQLLLADFQLRGHENGLQAIRLLRNEHPGLKALLISGNTTALAQREAATHGLTILHKPVTFTQLEKALTILLAPDRGAP